MYYQNGKGMALLGEYGVFAALALMKPQTRYHA